jgi:hypothetical protein
MPKMPKPGDHVSWETSQGQTEGTVEKTVTSTTHIKRHAPTLRSKRRSCGCAPTSRARRPFTNPRH